MLEVVEQHLHFGVSLSIEWQKHGKWEFFDFEFKCSNHHITFVQTSKTFPILKSDRKKVYF